jgi:ribosomal protein S27AE
MKAKQQPTREAFTAFWKESDIFHWRQLLPYVLYPGGLALYAFVIRWIDTEGRFWLASLIVATGYVVLIPYIWIRKYHKRFARFIRCPRCGDWFGQDASRAYSGPNPKFRDIIESGHCSNCGERVLSDHEKLA